MPPERTKAAQSERKPYVRCYRPFTVRLEQLPSRTPSPTGFLSSMRKEYEPSSPPSFPANINDPGSQPQPEPPSETEQRESGESSQIPSSQAGPSVACSSEEKLQAPPDKAYDPSVTNKIRQPKGGLGKPNSGGYSLSLVLESHGWSADQYDTVKKEIRTLTVLHLDTSKSWQHQKDLAVKMFLQEVVERYPGMEYYENEWPARNLAYQYLKNRKERNAGGNTG